MQNRKTLLIGWDAADWKMITPLMEQGKMPNLKKFVDEGVSGNLSTLQPVLSPMLWTSISTGKRPYKHGIHGFSEPDPVNGGVRPVTNLSRKTKAVWNILNQEEKDTITVGWWPSNPVEELSRGIMVSNDYQRAIGNDPEQWPLKKGTIHPQRLNKILKELRFHPAELEETDLKPFLPGLEGMSREDLDKVEKDPRVQSLMKIIADCTSIHSAATALMQNESWDLMSVYYDAIDHFGHAFMKYNPPQRKHIDDWDYKVFNYCMEAGYRFHDMMLGTLINLAGEDTTIILMSDHGFHPDDLRPSLIPREPAGPAVEHRQFGIFVAKGPDLKAGEKLYGASLIDICPTLLHLHGLPVGEDMDGKVLTDIYQEPVKEIASIPSWDDVPGDHGMHSPDKQISAAESKAGLEQLVALGYIDEPDQDQSTAIENTVRELDFNLAQAYIDGGIYNHAVEILERLYTRWPMEHRFGFQLTTCYKAQNRTADLRTLVTTIIERRIQEAEEAVTELKSLGLEDEDKQKAEKEMLDKMSDKERDTFARKRRELIGKSRPNIYTLRYLEAFADYSENLYSEALEKLDTLDKDLGARRNALCLRGDIHARTRNWSEARKAYDEALNYDQEYPAPLQGLARVAIAERKFSEAAKFAQNSINLLFFQPKAHYLLGIARYRSGKIDQAEKAFITCLEQAPLFAAAYHKLADIARYHRHDPHAYVLLRKQVKAARERLKELRDNKISTPVDAAQISSDEVEMPAILKQPEGYQAPDANEVITIVSGLPRSGTSLMMQMLESTGMPVYTDGKRIADESNKKGYYEHDVVSGLMKEENKQWLQKSKGQCLKVVAPLLAFLPNRYMGEDKKPHKLHYRVLFMERTMEEVLDSQQKMLERNAKSSPNDNVSKAYIQQVKSAKSWCLQHGIPAMSVSFSTLINEPQELVKEIAEFIRKPDQVEGMLAVVDPTLSSSNLTGK